MTSRSPGPRLEDDPRWAPVIRAIDRFVPPRLLAERGENLTRARLIASASGVAAVLIWLLGAGTNFVLGLSTSIALWNLGLGTLVLVTPFALRATGSPFAATSYLMGLGCVSLAGLFVGSGCTNFSVLYSIPILPLVAMLLGGPRAGALWTALSALTVVALVKLPGGVESVEPLFVPDKVEATLLRDVLVVTLWVAMFAAFYDAVRSLALRDARRARDRATRSEERLARVFAANPDGIVIAALDDDRILECNDAFLGLLGLERAAVVGRLRWSELLGLDAATRDDLVAALRETGRTPEIERALPPRAGRAMHVVMSATALEVDGRPCILTDVRDVTERRHLDDQLRQAQKMEAVGQLAGSVAHDFNNMLTVISGYAEHLRAELDGELGRVAEEIHAAAERSAALTGQLLAFSRRQVLQPQVIDLNVLLRKLETLVRRLIGEGVDFAMELAPGLGCVRADPGQLEQIAVNLAINARDAMPEGGTLRFETANVAQDVEAGEVAGGAHARGWVRLRVEDTGQGMDEPTLARAFEPFFTTKEEGRGTGLGLSTVHGIVRQSGGEIRIRSELGKGSVVDVYLPRVEGAPEEAEHAAPAEGTAGRCACILLVEDEEMVRRLGARNLRAAGHRVVEAENGREALDWIESHPGAVDLVVSDVRMPSMSGAALAAALAERHPELPILFVSGYPDPTDTDCGLPPGAPFIRKPFGPDELRRRVAELLEAA